jgi:hypothetical protein
MAKINHIMRADIPSGLEQFDMLEEELEEDFLGDIGAEKEDVPQAPTKDGQKQAFQQFDLPIPGQSLTQEPGNSKYEQPPQYVHLEDFTDSMFNSMTKPTTRKNMLRLLDSGVPVSLILKPLILQAVNEGKINMDLAVMALRPLATIIAGFGYHAGINVVMTDKKEDIGIDPRPLEKAFKNKRKEDKELELPDDKSSENLVSRRV